MLIPISAGTTVIDSDAKSTFLLNAIKRNAITIVEGRVPIMPPTFVPYLSAIMVIAMTIDEAIKKGRIN
jgi:hypothetical protein